MDDLDSEGYLAFFECIKSQKYDASKGKLTTFLYPHIKGAMHRWLEKNVGSVSLSKNKMETIRYECSNIKMLFRQALFNSTNYL